MSAMPSAYERDPRLTVLDTRILSVGEDGGRPYAVLEDTILFPAGGGQPADLGSLDGVPVVDVERREGEIRHWLAAPVAPGPARVELDWRRRFDHMQQHTAQHLLTAVALDRFGWKTTAFHLGPETSDVELDTAPPTAARLGELEEAVAAEIRAARPVSWRRVTPEEMKDLPVRSRGLPAGHTGDVRLVEIAGIDLNTCGGTHLASTAEIETVKLLAAEPMRGGTRLVWVAGGRVRARLGQREAILEALRRTFDSGDPELVAVAAKKLGELRDAERTRRRLLDRLAEATAAELAAAPLDGGAFVEAHLEDSDGGALQRVAQRFTALAGPRVALLTAESAGSAFFALAAGEAAGVDLADFKMLGARAAELLGGRGGGSGRLYQGRAGSLARRGELVAELRARLAGGG